MSKYIGETLLQLAAFKLVFGLGELDAPVPVLNFY